MSAQINLTFFTLLFSILQTVSFAQGTTFEWAKNIGGTNEW